MEWPRKNEFCLRANASGARNCSFLVPTQLFVDDQCTSLCPKGGVCAGLRPIGEGSKVATLWSAFFIMAHRGDVAVWMKMDCKLHNTSPTGALLVGSVAPPFENSTPACAPPICRIRVQLFGLWSLESKFFNEHFMRFTVQCQASGE